MKVAILAGGAGSRLAEETETKPKPMIEIGGKPILWHIMMHYAHYGFKDFVIALGYKGEIIKKYMIDYCELNSNLTVNLRNGEVQIHGGYKADWNVALIDTKIKTNTGGRIKRLAPYLGKGCFMMTWGDGVSDVNLHRLLEFHRSHGKLATLTAVRPSARFGHISLDGNRITEFSEKPQLSEGWINGAFFVLEPEVFDYIEGDSIQWEKGPLEKLAREGQLMAFIACIRRTVDSEKNTIVFFQVPNVIRIFTETAFWDIYYEHCSYFTAFSLRGLFERAGFEVLNTWTDYNDQYLMLQARPGESALERDDQAHETENIHRVAKIFARKHSLVIARWKRFIEYGPAKRIALWGSGSKAVGFLNTIQSTGRVGCIVDINPYRQKTFSAGTGQPIVSAEFLRSYKPDLVIIINPVYKEEIRDYLDRMNLKPNLMMSTEFV